MSGDESATTAAGDGLGTAVQDRFAARLTAFASPMARAIAQREWAGGPLGAVADWPVVLRSCVMGLFDESLPALLVWGDARTCLINDACSELLEDDPAPQGAPFARFCVGSLAGAEAWVERAFAGEGGHGLVIADGGECDVAPVRDGDGVVRGASVLVRSLGCRANDDRLRLATEAAQLGVFEWDPVADRTVWQNPRMYAIFGFEAGAEPLSRERFVAEALHPGDRERFAIALAASMRHRSLFGGRYRIRRAGSARWYWIELFGRFAYDAHGEATRLVSTVQDVTEQVEAEAERDRLLVQQRAIMESMSDGLVLVDPAGEIIYHNPASLQLHGYRAASTARITREQAVSEWENHDLAGRPLPVERWPIPRALAGERFSDYVVRVRRRGTDHTFIASYSGAPVYSADGEMLLALVTIRDVTAQIRATEERQRLTDAQRKERRFLETLLDSSRACVAVMRGHALRYELVNRSYQALRPDVSMPGRTYHEVFPDAMSSGVAEVVRQVLTTGEPHEDIGQPFPVPGKSDSTWDRQIVRLPLEPGTEPAALILSWDSTAHHRLQQRLVAQEARFRTLANNISQFAWMTDPSGWIFWYNQRWYDYTGTDLAQMQGWGWRAVHHPDHVDRVVARFQQCLETGEPWEDTFPLRHRDGSYRWFLSRALPIRDEHGAIVRWFGTNTDITESREIQADLQRRTVELAAANHELEAFAYSVSHDLRAPLRQVRMFGDLLLADHGAELNHAVRGYLDRILGGAERMDGIIEDMLALSRISRHEMVCERVDLSQMADAMLVELHERDPTRQVGCAIEPGLHAHGDPGLLHMALANLLGNAWKYTGRRAAARIRVGAVERDGASVFFVEDNGAGFSMDHAAGLYEPFKRLHSGSEFGGTGVGLAIVARVIDRHGGQIWAEAAIDQGATFFFTLG